MPDQENEIKALLALVDDPDEEVYSMIRNRILSMGEEIIPSLEEAWENHFDHEVQQRLEGLIHEIQFSEARKQLIIWRESPNNVLIDGAFLLARYQYPELDKDESMKIVDTLISDAMAEITPTLSPLEKVKVLNHVIYDIHGFRGNKKNFHAPQNSYINDVLQTRKGNPLSLSILYTTVAQALGIPIHGVNLPEHFIMAYVDEIDASTGNKEIPFYINAFNRGAIFTRNEIELFIRQMKIEPKERYFVPCTNQQVLQRMLHNLIAAYDRLGYPDKIRELRELIAEFS